MSSRPVIMGELGLISLFDLGQLLMLNGATGTLRVTSPSGRGQLLFERGQIVNAVDERLLEGEDAAYRVLGWRTGTFEFRLGLPPAGGRAIYDSTEGLMLEAARRLDEAGVSGGDSVTRALQSHAESFKSWHEDSQAAAQDSIPSRRTDTGDTGARFVELVAVGDALLYRPGKPVRLLASGSWSEADAGVIDPGAFRQLCGTFFASTADTEPARNLVVRENGRQLLVSFVPGPDEALLVRVAPAVSAAAIRLDGNEEALEEVLDLTRGLLLVGAPGIRAAEQLLHAVLAHVLERPGVKAVLAAERGSWRHGEAMGALLLTPRDGLAGALEALSPDVVAFDVAHADASLATLDRAPLVLCALVAPDAASLVPAWLARHGLTLEAAGSLPLAGAEVGVVFTPGASVGTDKLPVVAVRRHPESDRDHEAGRGGAQTEARGEGVLRSVIEQLRRELRDAA
jgi:hypothetical protein